MYEEYAKIRDMRGLKDSDVARATGISPGTLSDWKSGRYNLKYDKLKKIADFFEIPTDVLTGKNYMEIKAKYYMERARAEQFQELFDRPGLRALFYAARDISDDDLKLVTEMVERLKETNPDG